MKTASQLEIENAALMRCNTRLRAQITELAKRVPALVDIPPEWGLTAQEVVLVRALLRREFLSHAAILDAVWGGTKSYSAYDKSLHVLITHTRKKLAPLGVQITNDHGRGYRISLDDRRRLTSLARGVHEVAA